MKGQGIMNDQEADIKRNLKVCVIVCVNILDKCLYVNITIYQYYELFIFMCIITPLNYIVSRIQYYY